MKKNKCNIPIINAIIEPDQNNYISHNNIGENTFKWYSRVSNLKYHGLFIYKDYLSKLKNNE